MIPLLRRVARVLPVLALLAFCSSCEGFFVSNSSIQTIAVTPSAIILAVAPNASTPGDTFSLKASAVTVGGTSTDATTTASWTSSDPSVVTVTAGKVTVVGTTGGSTATITAKESGQSGTASVLTYTGTAPSTLSVNLPSGLIPTSITPGQIFALTAVATVNNTTSANISSDVVWSSSNTSAATVSANGVVTVLSTATTGTSFTITATAYLGPASATPTVSGTSSNFTILGNTLL